MNCETCHLQLEDLIYGELSSQRSQEVREHLADCSACRRRKIELEREQSLFAEYYERTSREPAPELWAAIRERIQDNPASPSSRVVLTGAGQTATGLFAWLLQPMVVKQLAGAFALVVLTVLATVFLISRRPEQVAVKVTPSPESMRVLSASPTPGQEPARENGGPGSMKNASQTEAAQTARRVIVAPTKPRTMSDQELIQQQLQRTEREYVAAIRMLDQAIAKRKGSIDGEVYKQYEASLALIDDSLDKSRAALRARMGDPVAGQFLLAAYARKVELMQEIALQ